MANRDEQVAWTYLCRMYGQEGVPYDIQQRFNRTCGGIERATGTTTRRGRTVNRRNAGKTVRRRAGGANRGGWYSAEQIQRATGLGKDKFQKLFRPLVGQGIEKKGTARATRYRIQDASNVDPRIVQAFQGGTEQVQTH